jgi:plasmid maintenance system antidote protein VapI
MENLLKNQLHSLHSTYSAINAQFTRIEQAAAQLESQRKIVSDVLENTRELEKDVINKLEEILGKKLTPNDILEIIKEYEEGDD